MITVSIGQEQNLGEECYKTLFQSRIEKFKLYSFYNDWNTYYDSLSKFCFVGSDGGVFVVVLLEGTWVPGDNQPSRPGDHEPCHVLTPEMEPGAQWCDASASTSESAGQLKQD